MLHSMSEVMAHEEYWQALKVRGLFLAVEYAKLTSDYSSPISC